MCYCCRLLRKMVDGSNNRFYVLRPMVSPPSSQHLGPLVDSEGNSSYAINHYLLWTISDVLGIMNAEDNDSYFMKFGDKLKFSTLYHLFKNVKPMYFLKHPSSILSLCQMRKFGIVSINRHVPSMKLPK